MRTARSIQSFVIVLALAPMMVAAQKKPEKPKVHSDFFSVPFPFARDAAELLTKEKFRSVLVATHVGWPPEKIAKELKISEDELETIFLDLDDNSLAGHRGDDETVRPTFPVIRDRDIERVQDTLQRQTHEFAALIRSNVPEIEAMLAGLSSAKDFPKGRLLYQTIVGDIMLGGLIDAFSDDKTLPPGPRHSNGQRYYSWLVESDPAMAGKLRRESWESEEYQVVSVGVELPKQKTGVSDVRSSGGLVLDGADARRYRAFINVLCRNKLLAFFKTRRADFVRAITPIEAGKYVGVGQLFAWYYAIMVDGVAAELAGSHLIDPPTDRFTFAVKTTAR